MRRAPESLGVPTIWGVFIENGCLLYERHPSKVFQKTLGLTQEMMLKQVVHHQPVPLGVNHKIFWIPIKGPHGLCLNHFSASPIRAGVAPKGKRITPCPEKMLGVVTPYHARSHSLEAQREWIGSLVSGSSVQPRRVLWVRG